MIAAVWRETGRHRGKWGRKKHKGIQCNVTADPSAFRHGHFHFHHADPSPITLPGTGETGREGRKEEQGQRKEKGVEVK